MFNKPFDEITKTDIERLVTDGIPEGRMLDYKAELPKGSDGEKKEFARDVTSFANAAGGYIVYGVTEQRDAAGKNTGVAGSADGLFGVSADQEILRMESMLRGNIDPIVPGLRFKKIEGFTIGPVILLYIPKSWAAPHMVTVDNDSRFYTRGSAGKQSMDVREIRSAFVLSAEMPTLIRRFRDERLGRIMADETPVKLMDGPKIVMHVVPFASLATDPAGIDLDAVAKARPMPSRTARNRDYRFNFDGWVSYTAPDQGANRSYLQVFRSGALEDTVAPGPSDYFSPEEIEANILNGLGRFVGLFAENGIEPPVVVAISLLGFEGATLYPEEEAQASEEVHPIDRNTLLLPDVLIRAFNSDLESLLKPAFDALAQALGQPGSLSYGKDGKRVKTRRAR
jgi:hypothetical protein